MIAASPAEWWDLGADADPSLATLSDSTHMTGPSATLTTGSILKALDWDRERDHAPE